MTNRNLRVTECTKKMRSSSSTEPSVAGPEARGTSTFFYRSPGAGDAFFGPEGQGQVARGWAEQRGWGRRVMRRCERGGVG